MAVCIWMYENGQKKKKWKKEEKRLLFTYNLEANKQSVSIELVITQKKENTKIFFHASSLY